MTKPQNKKPGFIHVNDSKIIGNNITTWLYYYQ